MSEFPAASERTLQRHCRWVDVHEALWLADEFGFTKGNRAKFVAYPDWSVAPIKRRPFRYYWKESLHRFPLEFWSEVLAYHIGAVVGVRVPPCFPATYTAMEGPAELPTRLGSLSLSLVEPLDEEELIHGGDLLSEIKPTYDRKKGTDHSVQLIIKALRELIDDVSLYREFFRQLVFDALIGNSDRHQDNWGVKSEWLDDDVERFTMLPAFDNGTSLGRELTEDKIQSCLRNPIELEAFINRGTAHVRWEGAEGALEHLRHEELMRRHLEAFPKSRATFGQIIEFDEAALKRAIRRVCLLSRSRPQSVPVALSEEREEFIIRVILRRRERLRNL